MIISEVIPMVRATTEVLKKGIGDILTISGNDVRIVDEKRLRETLIDDLIRTAVFAPEAETQAAARSPGGAGRPGRAPRPLRIWTASSCAPSAAARRSFVVSRSRERRRVFSTRPGRSGPAAARRVRSACGRSLIPS